MRTIIEKRACDFIDERLIASVLREDYRLPPWNEDLMCPVCKGQKDFGPEHVFAGCKINRCPICSASLVSFWSDERMDRYLDLARGNPGFLFLEIWEDQELAGWLWGFDLDQDSITKQTKPIFYIDVFAATPSFRGIKQQLGDVRHGFNCFRQGKYEDLPGIALEANIPVYASLFLYLAHHQWRIGYGGLATRTHLEATHVKALLRGAGFWCVPDLPSSDPERRYWLSLFVI